LLDIKRLDINDAHILIASARAEAQNIGVAMCISVADESGNLIAFERMDGGKIPSVNISMDKSFTAAGIRKGTHELGEANQPGNPAHGISSALAGRMSVIAGGLPVVIDGTVVGAIGISSGTPSQDLAVAEAAVQAFCQNKPNTTL